MKIQSLRLQIVQINDEIRSLEEYKNNRCLPVSKLPPEVLSTIFESIAMTIEEDLEPYSDLLSATQVCRLWRQVALDSPRIWSFIYCSAPPRLVDLLLERSKAAPLHLLYSGDNVPENVEKLSRIISQGAPQLESLSLDASEEIDRFEPPVDAFPVLQHLELFGFVYTPSVASLTTLRSLIINASRTSLPNLSKLSLTEALTSSDGPLPSSSVRLAHLTSLYIQDADIRNIGLMACITAPQLKTIDLHHSGKASAEIATPVVAAIFQKLPTLTTSYSALTLGVGGSSFARVELWDDCVTSGTAKRAPFFEMVIHGTGDLRTEESILTLFPPTTYPPTLHFPPSIQIASDHSRYAPLRRILRQLTRVTEVRTSGLGALTNLLDDAHPISLPSLKQIVLETDYDCMDKQELLAKFVEQLKVRKGLHDVEIETFVVFDIKKQLTPADLKLFEGLVKVSKRKTKRRDQHVF
ncbi:hypothetical protein CCMSSC00406_0010424 [Pleurotus cornucopiae]|uniref:Uncharacterized protein n=1 Tax=Pleurotus cornucopiae TaxID=5321 RepID=A0ACB7IIU2_PLECO|nr:hypothetical protein CCMSSC00406_0010424 [Pleurotus cornucopiae]